MALLSVRDWTLLRAPERRENWLQRQDTAGFQEIPESKPLYLHTSHYLQDQILYFS